MWPGNYRKGADRTGWAVIWLAAGLAGGWTAHASVANPAPLPGAPLDSAAAEFFENHVRPVLIDHCYSCHSTEAKNVRGDFLLDTKAGWEKGGASGRPALIPGNVEESPLIRAVRHEDPDLAMPPKTKLSEEQIEVLVAWVKMGAPDPRVNATPLPDPAARAREHWAFQPVREPALPGVKDAGWVKMPVDRFVLASLEARGMKPAPQADPRTLIRRASFVLTGLPPTMEDVERFVADESDEAFARVVDRLLASPRYGERWGRHWLDVARYADTKGYVFEEERRYPYAYTYRDYVIRAFNEDKPYDRFLVEQIAADQVGAGEERSALAAMGFLTLGRRFLNNQHDIIDDRIDVLTRGTMALTVACARCHDHKYDPVPIADYYSLYGVFASSQEPGDKPLLGTITDPAQHETFRMELVRREKERDEFVAKKESEHRRKLRETVGDYLLAAHEAAGLEAGGKREELARSRQLSPVVVNRWISALEGWKKEANPLFVPWADYAALPAEGFGEAAKALTPKVVANADGLANATVVRLFEPTVPGSLKEVADRYNGVFAAGEDAWVRAFLEATGTPIALEGGELHALFNVPEAQKKRALQRAVEELEATHPGAPPRGMVLEDKASPVQPAIFKRGNPGNRGETVPRQFLALLSGPERKPFQKGSGRLELAEAIASPENPLTARVAVNRIWLHHFGAGLVRTPADFGLRSDPPTHPELLDWLASRFVADGWSFKRIHRQIMLSSTWQQSSDVDVTGDSDPENLYLGRQIRRRLDFESMRDTLLGAAGRLDLAMGGHGVEITTRDYIARRTVYGFVERQNLPGVFRTFDFASPDTSSAQRFQTTVPQQALFLMNSPFALDQARQVMRRADVMSTPDTASRVAQLYELILQREPQPVEVDLAGRFLARHTQEAGEVPGGAVPLTAWERYAQVLLMSNEAFFVD